MSITDLQSVVPLATANLREQARTVIRSSITTGELDSGRLYTIGSLAKKLGVSATPVREALGDLEQVGLVKIMRNRGFIVPALTEHDLDEIFQLRLMLETSALTSVADVFSEADEAACRVLVSEGKDAARVSDLPRFLRSDRDFHLRLLEPLGNRRLIEILGQLRDHTRLLGLRELAASGMLPASADEHAAILDAVVAGDKAEVRRQITNHLRHTRGAWAGLAEESD